VNAHYLKLFPHQLTPLRNLSITMAKAPVHVMITGAAGQIGYALAPMVARGAMLGPDQPVVLHLLDIEPAAEALEGVKMELLDAAFPLLHGMCSRLASIRSSSNPLVSVAHALLLVFGLLQAVAL
jgi:hypothetical protein